MNMLNNKFLSFILFALITYSASVIGGMATIGFKEPWYSLLIKPSFNPPDWIFAPVWTTLYLMMFIAIWNFWHNKKDLNTVCIYFIHLVFNTTWSIVFFVFHKIFLALVVLVILICLIVFLIVRFKRVSLISFYLMIPYLLWCFYALILNISLLRLN